MAMVLDTGYLSPPPVAKSQWLKICSTDGRVYYKKPARLFHSDEPRWSLAAPAEGVIGECAGCMTVFQEEEFIKAGKMDSGELNLRSAWVKYTCQDGPLCEHAYFINTNTSLATLEAPVEGVRDERNAFQGTFEVTWMLLSNASCLAINERPGQKMAPWMPDSWHRQQTAKRRLALAYSLRPSTFDVADDLGSLSSIPTDLIDRIGFHIRVPTETELAVQRAAHVATLVVGAVVRCPFASQERWGKISQSGQPGLVNRPYWAVPSSDSMIEVHSAADSAFGFKRSFRLMPEDLQLATAEQTAQWEAKNAEIEAAEAAHLAALGIGTAVTLTVSCDQCSKGTTGEIVEILDDEYCSRRVRFPTTTETVRPANLVLATTEQQKQWQTTKAELDAKEALLLVGAVVTWIGGATCRQVTMGTVGEIVKVLADGKRTVRFREGTWDLRPEKLELAMPGNVKRWEATKVELDAKEAALVVGAVVTVKNAFGPTDQLGEITKVKDDGVRAVRFLVLGSWSKGKQSKQERIVELKPEVLELATANQVTQWQARHAGSYGFATGKSQLVPG